MAVVPGLRPTDSNRPSVRQKKGRTATRRDSSPRVGLNPAATPVSTYTRPAMARTDDNIARLANALGELAPSLAEFAVQRHRELERSQEEVLRYLTELFMKDKQMGAISAAQVGEVLPETVPTIRARIAEATGLIEGKKWVESEIEAILNNDEIRLNTEARRAAIDQIRAKALEFIGDNKFYGNGFLSQIDRSLAEYESAWLRETAAHHQQVQAEAFSMRVAEAIRQGGDTLALDDEWKNSSLNNLERKRIVLDTYIAEAVATNNPKLLDTIPTRFLNAEAKAKIAQTKQQIEAALWTQFSHARQLDQWRREQQIRDLKVEALSRHISGEQVSPADYYLYPEVFDYVTQLISKPRQSSTVSVRNAASFRSNVLRAGTTGSYLDAFADDPEFLSFFRNDDDVTEEALRDHILSRSDMNPEEQQKLLDEIPQLMAGVNWLRDPDVKAYFSAFVESDLKVFAEHPAMRAFHIKGINVQGDVNAVFYETLRAEVNAYIEEHNQLPTGRDKLDILKRATQAAKARLEWFQTNWSALLSGQTNTPGAQQPGNGRITNNPQQRPTTGRTIRLPNGTVVEVIE